MRLIIKSQLNRVLMTCLTIFQVLPTESEQLPDYPSLLYNYQPINYKLLNSDQKHQLSSNSSETCFNHTAAPNFGCFENLVLIGSESRELVLVSPQSPLDINVTFRLIEPSGVIHSFGYQTPVRSLTAVPLDPNRKTLFLVHGWRSNFTR